MLPIKIITIILLALLLLIVLGPFLVPIPPLQDTRPVEELIYSNSQFIQVNGINVHYQQAGQGEPYIILLHGFGASTFSWREVFQPLSQYGTVVAFDRPAFGLTQRPMPGEWQGESPYGTHEQAALLVGLMDALNIPKAILVGNSAGGTVATLTALEYPARVQALVEVDAAIYEGSPDSPMLTWLFNTPQMNHLGPLVSRSLAGERGTAFIQTAWHDPSKITPAILEGYRTPLQTPNWDIALWELTKASRPNNIMEQLGQIQVPTLVISGDDDRIVPTEQSLRLAKDIHGAELVVFNACGHLPQEECPQSFLQAVTPFIMKVGNQP
jgi:pimeloyl-ACP methyl ester carboxylesterase